MTLPVSVITEMVNDPREGYIISKCQMRIGGFCMYHTFPDTDIPSVMTSQTNHYSLQALIALCHLPTFRRTGRRIGPFSLHRYSSFRVRLSAILSNLRPVFRSFSWLFHDYVNTYYSHLFYNIFIREDNTNQYNNEQVRKCAHSVNLVRSLPSFIYLGNCSSYGKVFWALQLCFLYNVCSKSFLPP
jgi:hypothetical protein